MRAIQWNLHYYYNGCKSWSWYYPHHFAPWITDIKGFSNMDLQFELSKPFQPFEQLLSVLPAASKELLPKVCNVIFTTTMMEKTCRVRLFNILFRTFWRNLVVFKSEISIFITRYRLMYKCYLSYKAYIFEFSLSSFM